MLFDMDGTLVDSERLWDVALRELAVEYGGLLSDAARVAMVGSDAATSMRILHADLGQQWRPLEPSQTWIARRMTALFRTGLVWRPGALALLRAVRTAGLPTALVTSTARPLVEVALETLGRHNFDVVVAGDEVHTPKPHPEPYRLAAHLLGVPIERCVAIEDSRAGVTSALAAGAAVLGVPSEVPLDPADGLHLLETLAGVDLTLLGTLLAPAQATH
ncbi:HAD family hydrolase [Phytohabitans suffuscus]|uniref:HAD family hydrolase n=1 Tax=Phytohabitans suffuscus TaxID=624315 RepID=UPI001565499D|nr:HAD family hydrolase [Phytohabitans suffuscus]